MNHQNEFLGHEIHKILRLFGEVLRSHPRQLGNQNSLNNSFDKSLKRMRTWSQRDLLTNKSFLFDETSELH
jgi:hypothetical protein